MKIIHIIPPLSAALFVGALLWFQRIESQALLDQRAVLESTVAQAKAKGRQSISVRAQEAAKTQAGNAVAANISKKLELADFLAAFSETNGMPDMRAMLKIQTSLENMSPAEIQALVAEATTAKLTETQKGQICDQLLAALGKQDPKMALEEGQKLTEAGLDRNLYQLRGVFEKWAGKDPAAATAWLDGQIAAGKLENTSLSDSNQKRVSYETGLIASHLSKDPALAEARLRQLSPEDRKAVLENSWNFPTNSEGQQGYVKLVRTGDLDADVQKNVLTNYASTLNRKGELKDVTEFLQTSKASPEETTRIVETCASDRLREKIAKDTKNITAEKTADWRNWVMQSDPEHAGSIIGKSLSRISLGDNAISAVEAVSPPNQSDAVKQALVENSNGNITNLRELANSITDEKIRTKVIETKWPADRVK